MPEWSNMTDKDNTLRLLSDGGAFLPWITNLDPALTLGLSNGSLYDVLQTASSGDGSAEISAVGFNITFGYIPGLAAKDLGYNEMGYTYNISSPAGDFQWIVLEDVWAQILHRFGLQAILSANGNGHSGVDWGSMNLMQQLGLNPVSTDDTDDATPSPSRPLYLQDIENALAALISSVFWIGNSTLLN
ncbi:hypothetical protein MSAN_00877500 [Mycena sanguinolenta]|uniref:Uncharacterized protein n=1 Tax=Mycena sanguinolenta TaxID=230812 RepID=A0A8H7DDH9_9AGAR|nr:hypothetical protein MSAN_00877500 [Mycena sanguinolenta]